MKSTLLKFKIGLLVLFVFTISLVVYVSMQAGKAKADLKTNETASKIADKLNAYTYQSGVPESLGAAGIRDVPDEIVYTKLSDTKFRFCITYRAESSGFKPDTVVQDAITGYYMGQLGGNGESSNYLFIKGSHKKGENCQEVKIPAAQDNFFDFDAPSSGTDSFDSSDLNQLYNSQPNQSSEMPDSYEYQVQ